MIRKDAAELEGRTDGSDSDEENVEEDFVLIEEEDTKEDWQIVSGGAGDEGGV